MQRTFYPHPKRSSCTTGSRKIVRWAACFTRRAENAMAAATNIYRAGGTGFKILHATRRSQTASMTLDPGESSSEKPNTHPESDQVLIVLEGTVTAEISGERTKMEKGDAVTI